MPSPPPDRRPSTNVESEESPDESETEYDDRSSLESNRSSLDQETLLLSNSDDESELHAQSIAAPRGADHCSASPGLSERRGYTKASPQLDLPSERPRIKPLTKLYDPPEAHDPLLGPERRGREGKGWRAVSFAPAEGSQDSRNRDVSPVPPYSPRRALSPEYHEEKGKDTPYEYLRSAPKLYRRREPSDTYTRLRPPHPRRTTSEMEAGASSVPERDSRASAGGIFSHLLRLSELPPTTSAGQGRQAAPLMPTLRTLGLKRSESSSSLFEGELDSEDPRVTGIIPRRRMPGGPFLKMFAEQGGEGNLNEIQMHVADLLTRQSFILKLAKALMNFGAPSHRIESQLSATALSLDIDAQFIHLPSIVIASFGDPDTRTSETHFIRSPNGDLDLGRLHQVHEIYRSVVHDQMDAEEGTRALHKLLREERGANMWWRVGMAFISCGMIAPMCFGGSILDGLAAGVLAGMLCFFQMNIGGASAMYSNVFEISIASLISFAARGLSTTGYFCYGAVATSGICMILPGYTILCGSLELASKNILAGSVRLIYAIIYSLFLGFGITLGSDLFYVVDPPARRAALAILDFANPSIVSGTFTSPSADIAWNGTFTFTNTTAPQFQAALDLISTSCPREAGWPWWRQAMPTVYLIGLVPIYSLLSALWSYQPFRSRELPVMVLISSLGFLSNWGANRWIVNRDDIVSAMGAFVVGVLGNVYSRIFKGGAFTSMVPGILFLVPSGISAAGGLVSSSKGDYRDSYSESLLIGAKLVQVAIGITVGLFGSGVLIYSFGRKKHAALFAF